MKNIAISLAAIISLALAHSPARSQSSDLTPNTQNIERVSVVSSRIALPTNRLATSVTVLDELDVKLTSALNITDLLRTTTSVSVSNSGGLGKNTVLRIRGEEGFRTKLYIDDVELSDTSSPQIAPIFDDVLTDQLSRVEILRGTQGLAYGADAGGVIALYTKEPEQGLSGTATFNAARYNTQGFTGNVLAGDDNGSLFLSASTLSSDGFNAQSSDLTKEEDSYDNKTVHFKGQYNVNKAIETTLVIRQVSADSHYDGCFDNTTFAPSNQCITDAEQNTYRASLKYTAGSLHHQVAADKTKVERRFINNGQFGFNNSGSIDKFEYLGSKEWQDHNVVFGLETRKESLESENISRKQQGVFAEWLGSFDDNLFVNLGIRHDDNDTFGQHTSIRAGLVKQLKISAYNLKLKTTYGTGFRAPSLFEQNYNDGPFAFGQAGGLQLEEEKSAGLDIGFELSSKSGSSLELVWFEQQIENEIVFDLSGFQGYLQAFGTSRSNGIELSVQHTFENGIYIRTNYTYNEATDYNNNQRLRRPKNKFNVNLRRAFFDDNVMISLNHRLVNDALDIDGAELDDYSVTDLSAQMEVLEYVVINAGLTNLFDREYQEVKGFNTARRSLNISVTISL